jgi:hypothetical protein
VEEFRLGGLGEAREQASGTEAALHATEQCSVAGRKLKRGDVEPFDGAIGERDRARVGLEAAHEERGFFDFDLGAKPTQCHDEDVIAVRAVPGKKADAAIEGLAQPAVCDRPTLVCLTTVVMKKQAERVQRRRARALFAARQLTPR